MATYPYSIARLVRPNAPQINNRDQRLAAIKRRLKGRTSRSVQRGSNGR